MAGINFMNCFYKDLSKMLKLTDPTITDDEIFAKIYEKYLNLTVQEKVVFEEHKFKLNKSESREKNNSGDMINCCCYFEYKWFEKKCNENSQNLHKMN